MIEHLLRRRVVAAIATSLALALLTVGCSNGSPSAGSTSPGATTSAAPPPSGPTPSPLVVPSGCRPDGPKLQISASSLKFSTRCLAAPAGAPFTIAFDNKMSALFAATHNISIYTDSTASHSLFDGEQVAIGDRTTYHVPELPAGAYFFRCDTHAEHMTGVLVVS